MFRLFTNVNTEAEVTTFPVGEDEVIRILGNNTALWEDILSIFYPGKVDEMRDRLSECTVTTTLAARRWWTTSFPESTKVIETDRVSLLVTTVFPSTNALAVLRWQSEYCYEEYTLQEGTQESKRSKPMKATAFQPRSLEYNALLDAISSSDCNMFFGIVDVIADYLDEEVDRCAHCKSVAINTSPQDLGCTNCRIGPCCCRDDEPMRHVLIVGISFRYCEACAMMPMSSKEIRRIDQLWDQFDQNCYCGIEKIHISHKIAWVPNAAKLQPQEVINIGTRKTKQLYVFQPQEYNRGMGVLDHQNFLFTGSEMHPLGDERCTFFGIFENLAVTGSGCDQWVVAGKILLAWLESQQYCDGCSNHKKLIV